ncbi:MAG: TRAP transporter small permease subunit [Rhodothalassiaceae bacterium]
MTGLIDRLERITMAGAIAALALLVLLGLAEVVLRPLGASLAFATEYAGYLTGLAFVWGLGPAMSARAHVRVALAAGRLGPVAEGIALLVSALAAWAMLDWAITSLEQGARSYFPSRTPLWLPQILFAWGLAMLVLSVLKRLLARSWN